MPDSVFRAAGGSIKVDHAGYRRRIDSLGSVDTVGRNKEKIAEYVRNQLQEDALSDQIGLREYFDPFTGEQVKQGKKSRFSSRPVNVMRLADHSRAFRLSWHVALIGPVQATRYAGGLNF